MIHQSNITGKLTIIKGDRRGSKDGRVGRTPLLSLLKLGNPGFTLGEYDE